MSGTETATLAEPAPHEIDLPSALHRERPPAGHLRVLDLCLAEGANAAYLDAGARVVGLRHGGTPLHVENSAGYFRLAEYDPSRPPKEWGVRADDWDLVLVGSDSRLEELTRMSTLLAAAGVLAWIGPRPATAEVADHMRSAGLRVRFDGPCAAPRSAGIRAPRWLAVGVDPRPPPVLEGAVARVDRTACVDRSRLLELPRRPLWRAPSRRSGSTKGRDLVAALEAQVEAGEREIDLESLPWHPRGRAPAKSAMPPRADVLAVFAHPDDESIYAGETISALARAGHRVHLLVLTDGAGGRRDFDGETGPSLASERRAELGEAARRLGIAGVEVLEFADFGKHRDAARTSPFTATDALERWGTRRVVEAISSRIQRDRPRAVLTFEASRDPNYSLHGHHLAVGVATTVAVRLADPGGSTTQWAAVAAEDTASGDVRGPVGDGFDRAAKRSAVQAHSTQTFSSARLVRALEHGDAPAEAWHLVQGRAHGTSHDPPVVRLAGLPAWSRAVNFPEGGVIDRWLGGDVEAVSWLGPSPANPSAVAPEAVHAFTGQQVGLFGGPSLTVHKALGAVAVARRHAGRASFWMATQDHDLDEITGLWIGHPGGARRVRWPASRDGRPVGARKLDDRVDETREAVVHALRAQPRVDELDALLREHYSPGRTLAEAFAGLLGAVVPEIAWIDPSAPELASAAAPIFTRLLEAPGEVLQALHQRAEELRGAGLALPVDRGTRRLPMFVADDQGRRRALSWSPAEGFVVDGTGVSLAWLRARLAENPGRFTPDVLLRPLVQDAIFGATHYVGGPNELAYWSQATALHRWAGVAPARLVQRPRVCVVDERHAEAWTGMSGATPAELAFDADIDEAAWAFRIRSSDADGRSSTLEARRRALVEVRERLSGLDGLESLAPDSLRALASDAAVIENGLASEPAPLGHTLRRLDPLPSTSLEAAARTHARARPGAPASHRDVGRAIRTLSRLEAAVVRAQRDLARPMLEARRVARPRSSDQDRVMSVAELVARFGTSIGRDLLERLDPWRETGWPRAWVVALHGERRVP